MVMLLKSRVALGENEQVAIWLMNNDMDQSARIGLGYALRRMAIPFGGNVPVVGGMIRRVVARALLLRLEKGRYTGTVWDWSAHHMFVAQPYERPQWKMLECPRG
jgi:hypothetical protein